MYYIIGSGPSGVMCAQALLAKNCKVTMLDVGNEPPYEVAKIVSELSQKDPSHITQQDIQKSRYPIHIAPTGLPERRFFGSNFAYSDQTNTAITQSNCHCTVSEAKGGFSTIWGGSVLPNCFEDFETWPITLADLAPHYKAVGEIMKIAASLTDPLLSRFPHYATPLPPPRRSIQAEYLFQQSKKYSAILKKRGISIGESRLALRTKPDDKGRFCRNIGLCLSGCPYGAVYSTTQTLEDMQKNLNFSYIGGVRVKKIVNDFSQVIIHGENVADGEKKIYTGQRVYLGCGPLGTARIVAASLPQQSLSLSLSYQPFFLIPLALFRNFQSALSEKTHTLNQLNIEIEDARISTSSLHLQLSTFNHMIEDRLRSMFKLFPRLYRIVRYFVLGRIVTLQAYAHSDEAIPMRVVCSKDPNGEVQITVNGAVNQTRLHSIARRTSLKLFAQAPYLRSIPIPFQTILGTPGTGSHTGSIFPMSAHPGELQTDRLGQLSELPRVHIIDSSVLPTLPATTITYTIMANAHRIGTESAELP